MELNEAALELKRIEIIEKQIKHLQDEAKESYDYAYARDCNVSAERLIDKLKG